MKATPRGDSTAPVLSVLPADSQALSLNLSLS